MERGEYIVVVPALNWLVGGGAPKKKWWLLLLSIVMEVLLYNLSPWRGAIKKSGVCVCYLLFSYSSGDDDDDGGARVFKESIEILFFVIYGMRYKEEPLLNNSIFWPMGDLFFLYLCINKICAAPCCVSRVNSHPLFCLEILTEKRGRHKKTIAYRVLSSDLSLKLLISMNRGEGYYEEV